MATSGSFNTTDYDGRYLTFAWALISQSYEDNSSYISWSLTGAGQGGATWYKAGSFKVIINGVVVYLSAQRINLYNGTAVASGNLTIIHEDDGTMILTASAEAAIHITEVNCQGSGSWDLPAINRYAIITGVSDFTDEQNPTIQYINPLGDNVDSLQASIEVNNQVIVAYRDIDKNGTSYTFELTAAEREALRNLSPESDSLTVHFDVRTIIEQTEYYSPALATMTIVNGDPTLSGLSYQDTNETTYNITGNRQRLIQGKSTCQFNISSIRALKGASLVSIYVTINSVTKSASLTGSSLSNFTFNFGEIDSSALTSARIAITDSRGNYTSAEINLFMLPYSEPTALISCARRGNYYNDTDLTVDAKYSDLDGENELTIEYQTQEAGSGSWSALTEISDGVTETLNLDNSSAWLVRVIVSDLLGSTSYEIDIGEGTPLVFIDRLKKSLSVNCLPRYENSFEINGIDPIYYHENDTIEIEDYYTSAVAISDTVISFTLKLDKIIGENDISFSELALSVISGGSSADYSDFLNVGSLSIAKASETAITITATISGSTYPVTANTVIGVIISGVITFAAPSPITWDYELSNVDFDGTANTLIFTGINPFSVANINRDFEILLNAETTQTAENKTDIGLFYRHSTTAAYNLELGIKPTQTYIDRYRNIGGSEQTINVGSSGQDVKISKIADTIYIYVNNTEIWRGGVSGSGSDAQEMTVGGVKMSGSYYFLGHLNYFKFRFTT